ncbi:MAG: glycosyltransferase family 8 protein [Rhodospirillaceae bacterium]|nr:glycosyltransferase family 8 protein [Rhodospirillaceae bacterium]
MSRAAQVSFGPPPDPAAIHLLMAFDEAYARYATVVLASVRANTAAPLAAHFAVAAVPPGIEAAARAAAERLAMSVTVHAIDATPFAAVRMTNHFSRATYFRLLAGELVAAARLVYLDCDLIVQDDIAVLASSGIGDAAVAGVIDSGAAREAARLGLPPDEPYLNAGVLVIDPAQWTALDVVRRSLGIMNTGATALVYHDQDLINIVLAGRKRVLPEKWNIQQLRFRRLPLRAAMPGPRHFRGIFHATGRVKPWHRWADPWSNELFLIYAEPMGVGLDLREPRTQFERDCMTRRAARERRT